MNATRASGHLGLGRAVLATILALGLAAGGSTTAEGATQASRPTRGEVPPAAGVTAATTVVVTLRSQADLSDIADLPRPQRLRTTITRLQSHSRATQAPLLARLATLADNGRVGSVTPLWVTDAVSLTATADVIRELAARPDVADVSADSIVVTATASPVEPNIATVRAPDLWAAGATGSTAVIATLDTGADLTNPDLAARWRGGSNSWFDPFGQHPATPVDLNGHGTGVAGVAVGMDGAGTAYGMAPGARFIAARVFDDRGASSATAMHQAFQWVLDPDHDPTTADAPQVVNGSWVLGSGPSCDLSLQPDLRALRAAGILPVFAAGNFGPTASTSASPANYPEALSVGAVDAADTVWAYSGAGPSSCGGRTRVYPDVVAPGVSVLTTDRQGTYQWLTGTSVAAPHVTGAVALLVGAHPSLPTENIESGITAAAVDRGPAGPDDRYGHGRLDVWAADQWLTSAPDLTLSVTPGAATAVAGASASFSVAGTPLNGYSASTVLSVKGLPAGTTWSFGPSALGPAAWTSSLVIGTSTTTAPGTYVFSVVGTAEGVTRSASAALTVAPAPDFSLTATPATVRVARGGSASTSITVATVGGFSSSVTLSLSTLPKGLTGTVSTNPVPAPGSSSIRFSPTTKVKAGTYPVVVTGAFGALRHSVTVSLVVS